MPSSAVRNLIIVAGHAPFQETTGAVPEHVERDDAWVLQPFQRGEPPLYIGHIRHGCALLAEDAAALLLFSGGFTRPEAGLRWSEAGTYAAIARQRQWWTAGASEELRRDLESRIATEDFSRDSFENLLFSLCRFQEVTGRYPELVTVTSWAFKRDRFDMHRDALRFPSARFRFAGVGQPIGLAAALAGEAITVREFIGNRYGNTPALVAKRAKRNPFHRQHGFRACPGMNDFFDAIESPGNAHFAGRLPWEN